MYLFGTQLRRWAEDEIAKLKGRRRSLSLPGGQIGFRSVPARITFTDEATVMRWARQHCPTAIAVAERLRKTPIHQHIQDTGELPEGVTLVGQREDFFVR